MKFMTTQLLGRPQGNSRLGTKRCGNRWTASSVKYYLTTVGLLPWRGVIAVEQTDSIATRTGFSGGIRLHNN